MGPVIAIIAAGAMGSAVGQRLVEGGARVLTSLEGRSPATAERTRACGMVPATDAEIAAQAELLLSIVPPAEALPLARRFATVLGAAGAPLYADCNAVDVATVREVEAVVREAGSDFVDGGVIGLPPKRGEPGPTLYLSGEAAAGAAAVLGRLGLVVRVIDGPVGAASALKMSYAGITKGLTAVAAAMVLAATRAGAADALRDELAASQPQLLARLDRGLPDMVPKAYRWVAEMREIAGFVGADYPEAGLYEAAAGLYARIAADRDGDGAEIAALAAFCRARPPG